MPTEATQFRNKAASYNPELVRGLSILPNSGTSKGGQAYRFDVCTGDANGNYPDVAYEYGSSAAQLARQPKLVDLTDKVKASTRLVVSRGDFKVPEDTDVVINATSIGLYPDVDARIALDTGTLKPNMIVADVIPNPPRTRLVRDAEARGCKVIDGLGMLVNQGVIGIKYWTGIDPEPSVMRKALEDVFGA